MLPLVNSTIPWIARPNEYERLVTDLIDRRFFGPVAISTSLRGARGLGKTRLARAICADRRVVDAFPDGIFWITLGESLSPLELLGRVERLILDLTGEQHGLTDLQAAVDHLRELIHPRKVLLVLDEASNSEMVSPFLQTGPGGGILIITYNDTILPLGARRTPVDIMVTEEAVALLSAGLVPGKPGNTPVQPKKDPGAPGRQASLPAERLVGEASAGQRPAGPGGNDPTTLADAAALTRLKQTENRQWAASVGLAAEAADTLTDLAGRLNEWPLLLALVNGLLRGCLGSDEVSGRESLGDAMRVAGELLRRSGLSESWPVTERAAREHAQNAVVTACLEQLNQNVRECLFELAVFPRFEAIPLVALSVLWEIDEAGARLICERLAERALITYDPAAGMIQLHPVLFTYIIEHLRAGVLADLHNRIIAGYAARCRETPGPKNPAAWATGPDDGYFFQHLARHLAAAGRRSELINLLFQFGWLAAYLACANGGPGRRADLYSLLIDYELALSTALDRQSAELRLVQNALRLSAPVLAREPKQLATQLLGRLLSFDEPEIQGLLAQSMDCGDAFWLRPLSACFTPPGNDEVRVLSGHTDWVTGLALLPDGQHAVSSSLDGSLRVWDLASGQTTQAIQAHPDGISAIVATPDGRQVTTASWDGWVRTWDLSSGEEVMRIKAHTESIGALAISPDGQRIVTGADDRLIRVWDRVTGAPLLELVGHGDLVRSLAISPDGRTLISGSWDSTVRIWDLEGGKQMHFLTGHTGWVPVVAISPDGAYALSGGWDQTLRIWDLWTGEPAGLTAGFGAPVMAIAFLPYGKELIAGTGDGVLHLLAFKPDEFPQPVEQPPARFDPGVRFPGAAGEGAETSAVDESLLAATTPPKPQLPPHKTFTGHIGGINAVRLTQEGRFAITASDDRTLRVWDLVAARGAEKQVGHSAPVCALANLPDGRHSLSGASDGTLKLWDLANGAEVVTLSGHSGGVVALAVSADGRRAISGAQDHTLKVWELPGGRALLSLHGHAGTITAVSISADGRLAVSGADDGTLRVWDLESGECTAEFRGEDAIRACAIDHDGRTVVASEAHGKMYFLEIRR
jgi:WD40 repeat protein